jgi:hypothetical protein
MVVCGVVEIAQTVASFNYTEVIDLFSKFRSVRLKGLRRKLALVELVVPASAKMGATFPSLCLVPYFLTHAV